MIGKYGPIATETESYDDGFSTGKKWDKDWVPGGPYVPGGWRSDKDWVAYCDQAKLNNERWLAGWRDGVVRRQDGVLS